MAATTVRNRRYRARVAPRRGPSRIARIQWERVARIALVLVLFAILISYVRPLMSLVDTWKEAKASETQLQQLQVENQELKDRAQKLGTPAAAMREARKLGMVAPGEQAFKVSRLK